MQQNFKLLIKILRFFCVSFLYRLFNKVLHRSRYVCVYLYIYFSIHNSIIFLAYFSHVRWVRKIAELQKIFWKTLNRKFPSFKKFVFFLCLIFQFYFLIFFFLLSADIFAYINNFFSSLIFFFFCFVFLQN